MSGCTHHWLLKRSRHDPDINRVITPACCKLCGEKRTFRSTPIADWVGEVREIGIGHGWNADLPTV